jgi:hypothetical protein
MLVRQPLPLDFPDFAAEAEEVAARAGRAKVGLMVTISTRLDRLEEVLAMAERFPQVYRSVGVHPHEAASDWRAAAATLVAGLPIPRSSALARARLLLRAQPAPGAAGQFSRPYRGSARERPGDRGAVTTPGFQPSAGCSVGWGG